MNESYVIIVLAIYCVVREVFFLINTHRLVNKLMSRSFHEYQLGQNVGRIKKPQDQKFKIEDMDFAEDFGNIAL